jgi:ribosomal protein L37E
MTIYNAQSTGFPKAKIAITLAICLALTPLNELENYHQEARRIGPSQMSDAWVTANDFFGSIWNTDDKEIVFDESLKIEPSKQLLNSEITAGAFTEDQIFGEGNDSAHNMCAYCDREVFKGKQSTIQNCRIPSLRSSSKLLRTSWSRNEL